MLQQCHNDNCKYRRSSFIVRRWPSVVLWLSFVDGCSFLFRRSSSVVRRPSSVVRRPSSVVRRPSSVVRRPSSVVRRPSSVVRRPSSRRSSFVVHRHHRSRHRQRRRIRRRRHGQRRHRCSLLTLRTAAVVVLRPARTTDGLRGDARDDHGHVAVTQLASEATKQHDCPLPCYCLPSEVCSISVRTAVYQNNKSVIDYLLKYF